jgi:hypothetical protein
MFADLGINRSALVRVGARRGDQKYWSVTLDPILHINQRGLVAFYVTGGGGIYSQITDYRFRSDNVGPYYGRDNFRGSYTLYKPGVDGGIGFSFPLAWHRDIRVFAEARYHHMFVGKSGVSFVPVTFGLRF